MKGKIRVRVTSGELDLVPRYNIYNIYLSSEEIFCLRVRLLGSNKDPRDPHMMSVEEEAEHWTSVIRKKDPPTPATRLITPCVS